MNTETIHQADWSPDGDLVKDFPFGTIQPKEVLYYLDGPRIFSFDGRDGGLYLAYCIDEFESIVRFVLVSVNQSVMDRLLNGNMTLRSVLVKPLVWIADLDGSGMPLSVWRLAGSALPTDLLPEEEVTIDPDLREVNDSFGGKSQLFQRFGTIGKGLHVTLRWTGAVAAEILLWIDDTLIWGTQTAGQPLPVGCTPPEILTSLARGWQRLFVEEHYPKLTNGRRIEHPGRLRDEVLRVWQFNGDWRENKKKEASDFIEFLKAHTLTRHAVPALHSLGVVPGSESGDDDSITLLKQGSILLVANRNSCHYLPLRETRKVLEQLGDAICQRLMDSSITPNPFAWLVEGWKDREKLVSLLSHRVYATGLDEKRIEVVWPARKQEEGRAPFQQGYEEPLRLVARMIGNVADDGMLKNLLRHLSGIGCGKRDKLLEIQGKLRKKRHFATGKNLRVVDYRQQGVQVAQWFREFHGIKNEERVEPKAILEGWGVECSEFNSHIPFDVIAIWGKTLGPVVYVNPNGPRSKFPSGYRFTLAHEISHLLMDMDQFLPYGDVLTEGSDSLYVFNGHETRANAFAAELLLPEQAVGKRFNELAVHAPLDAMLQDFIAKMAVDYGVSHELVAWKLIHTGSLSSEYKKLLNSKLHSINQPF